MKKFIRQLTIFSLIFIMTFSVGFSSQKGINVQAATTQTTTKATKSQIDVDAETRQDMDAVTGAGEW